MSEIPIFKPRRMTFWLETELFVQRNLSPCHHNFPLLDITLQPSLRVDNTGQG